ncbi:MAG: type 4a pilus biogenesis protein PilO [Polyangiaceae bacterium]|nr:type 4a pilus biogenesis protein PilO [Polyangiaceae bacterium]
MAKESLLARVPLPAKAGIIVAVLALIGVAYWVVFYGEVSQRIQSEIRREDALKGQLAEAKKAEIAYQKDLAELHEREQRKSEIEKVLPSEAQYPAFLSSVQTVANLSGVNLMAWSPSLEVKEQFYAKVPMKVKLTGRYHRVAKFFEGVSQLDRVINMEDISMTSPKEDGDEIIVTVDALATAFRSLADGDKTEGRGAPGAPSTNKGTK